jgi:cyclic di-GMP phosphodiesterase
MKTHTLIGERLCGELRTLRNVRPIVRHHHERLDGSGYPDGLCDAAIPVLAQIVAIVDVFDALTTDRPYRAALSFARATKELRLEVARGWRRGDLVAAFLDQIDRRERAAQLDFLPHQTRKRTGGICLADSLMTS